LRNHAAIHRWKQRCIQHCSMRFVPVGRHQICFGGFTLKTLGHASESQIRDSKVFSHATEAYTLRTKSRAHARRHCKLNYRKSIGTLLLQFAVAESRSAPRDT
jgi:hypothetical protein